MLYATTLTPCSRPAWAVASRLPSMKCRRSPPILQANSGSSSVTLPIPKGGPMFPITTALMIVILILVSLYSLHKLRSIHLLLHQTRDDARSDFSNTFQQLEALQALYVDLK